jgi:nucleotidyltransferase substrate binding protein (TIGR01987 family)
MRGWHRLADVFIICSMALDFQPLTKALASLDKALVRAKAAVADEELRDACIQRFEFSFELCWKMIKRTLVHGGESAADIDSLSKRGLFRTAFERGWIASPDAWFEYLTQRNQTSHTYDAAVAAAVAAVIPQFHADAVRLLHKLESAID